MNGFHVHAVGWILIFNSRACTPEEARGLTRLWEQVVRSHSEDLSRACLFRRVMQTRSIRLSKQSVQALANLIRSRIFLHPERFSLEALRKRRNCWAAQVLLGFALCAVSAHFLPRHWPFAPEVIPTFLLLGLLSVIPPVLLWRAATAVKYCKTEIACAEVAHVSQAMERLPKAA